ncbi:MAG TPA: alpha/beta hydrolase-fold protein [Phycisphaeraceae bacterium]
MNVRHRLLSLVMLLLAGHALAAETPVRVQTLHPRVEAVTFYSEALEAEKTFCVVLPEGYDRARDGWPVLFLFHGRGRHERSLIDDEATRQTLLAAPFVTVLPDGDDGWYIDSPVQPGDRYEVYTKEVIAHADQRYRLSRDAARRGLSGWSMGGYGCVLFAERHADDFGAIAPMIGLLDFPRTGLPAGQSYDVPINRFGEDRAVWRRLNPIHHAKRLRSMRILIITAADAFDRTMNMHFHQRLNDLGIEHRLEVLEGAHTFRVVQAALPKVTRFMADAIAGPSPASRESTPAANASR